MKSVVIHELDVAKAMLKDIAAAYPGGSFEKDQSRLTRYFKDRGKGIFSFDLPELDAILLDGLEEGRLKPCGPLSKVVSKSVQVPVLFRDLWIRIFDQDGVLKHDADETAIFFLRSLFAIGKRIVRQCTPVRLEKAVREYVDVDEKLPKPSLTWDGESLGPIDRIRDIHLRDYLDVPLPLFRETEVDSDLGRILTQCQRVADIFARGIGPVEALSQSESRAASGNGSGFRHGPGAVAERSGSYDKYVFTNWSSKLDAWFPRDLTNVPFSEPLDLRDVEYPSRLIAVAKTAKTPRLIAAEPSEHQWCQQFVAKRLYDFCHKTLGKRFITFTDQSKSQELARIGSLDKSLATIDLSSASDRLSCKLVERAFRKNPLLLAHLHAARTRTIEITKAPNRELLLLRKFCTQGTAVTFPVQSIVFLILAIGVSLKDTTINKTSIRGLVGKVRVFGDDIILPSYAYADMCKVLTRLDLRVNRSKSFVRGFFRESCGGDFYRGYDVTPVKPTTYTCDGPESLTARIDTANNFYTKGLWYTSKLITDAIPKSIRLPYSGSDSGPKSIRSFQCSHTPHLNGLPVRWDPVMHRNVVKMTLFSDKAKPLDAVGRSGMAHYFNAPPANDLYRTYAVPGRPRPITGARWVDISLFTR